MKTSNKVNGTKTANTVKTIVAKSDKEIAKEVAKQVREDDKSTKNQIKKADESIKGIRTKILAYNSDKLIEIKCNASYLKVLRLSKKDVTVFQTIDLGSQTVSGKNTVPQLIKFLSLNFKTLLSNDQIALNELKKVTAEKLDKAIAKHEAKKAERLALKEAELKEEEEVKARIASVGKAKQAKSNGKAKQAKIKETIKAKKAESKQTVNA